MLALSILYAGKQQYVSVIVVGEARMVKLKVYAQHVSLTLAISKYKVPKKTLRGEKFNTYKVWYELLVMFFSFVKCLIHCVDNCGLQFY